MRKVPIMQETQLQSLMRERMGLRIGREMAAYLLRHKDDACPSIPLIADDARTGAAMQRDLPLETLRKLLAEEQP
jgi:hypothetical protein